MNLTTRRNPFATTPLADTAFPARTSFAPTIDPMYWTPGECIAGFSIRLIWRAKALARTGAPLLKRKPLRSVNVYVLPSRETRG